MILQYKNENYFVDSFSSDSSFNYFNININNENQDIKVEKTSENTCNIITKNGTQKAYFAKDNKRIYVMIDSFQYIFDLKSESSLYSSSGATKSENHESISSPMPGSIVAVLVKEGDDVEEGTPLIIVEAMKMETKLYSSIKGKVKKINCKEGEQVDTDLVLVEIENN